MKKVLLILAGIIIVIVVVVLLVVQSKPLEVPADQTGNTEAPADTNAANTNTEPQPQITVKTYQDPSKLFEIDYPDFYIVSTEVASTWFGTLKPVVGIKSPDVERTGTNLNESSVYVAFSKVQNDVQRCIAVQQGETKLGAITVGGSEFTIFTNDGAAAGNIYQTVRYRTDKNQTCFEAVLLMHSGNIGNYPAGTVKEFDRVVTLERLKAIFYSLRLK